MSKRGEKLREIIIQRALMIFLNFPSSDPIDDRRWEFACGSGGNVANVSSVCTLQVYNYCTMLKNYFNHY